MDSNLLNIILLGNLLLSGLILMVGSFVPVGRRGVSSWAMISGMLTGLAGLLSFLLVEYAIDPYSNVNHRHEIWTSLVDVGVLMMPTGLLIFSGGFLLCRFEARRQVAELEGLRQAVRSRGSEDTGEGP